MFQRQDGSRNLSGFAVNTRPLRFMHKNDFVETD